jgi:hypothetical protein
VELYWYMTVEIWLQTAQWKLVESYLYTILLQILLFDWLLYSLSLIDSDLWFYQLKQIRLALNFYKVISDS